VSVIKNKSLYRIVKDLCDSSDFSKCYVMACLARMLNHKHYTEIGVTESLFAVSAPFILAGGTAVGIGSFSDAANSDAAAKKNGFSESVHLINDMPSNFPITDMLHINRDISSEDYERYCSLLPDDGVIVFSGANLQSDELYLFAKQANPVLHENFENVRLPQIPSDWAILLKSENEAKARSLGLQVATVLRKIETFDTRPVVSVGVLAYNHGKYIRECLQNIFDQRGYFSLKIRICEDRSTDNTVEVVQEMLAKIDPCAVIDAELIINSKNIGMVENFKKMVYLLTDGDFFTMLDGDDFWCDKDRISAHIDFLNKNSQYSFSFNSYYVLWQKTGERVVYPEYEAIKKKKSFETADLAKVNFIGNLGVGFYRAKFLKSLSPKLFEETYCGDWMFNIAFSRFGQFAYLKKRMNVYRKHESGIWTGLTSSDSASKLLQYIKDYNKYTEFRYDDEFHHLVKHLYEIIVNENPLCDTVRNDILISDTIFPHPLSGFRKQEYTSLLEHFEKSQVISCLPEKSVLGGNKKQIVQEYKAAYSHIAHKLRMLDFPDFQVTGTMYVKLHYSVFLDVTFAFINYIERGRIPFVFTLYPGGGFFVNDPDSDERLKRVLTSDYFQGVIVTQKNIYDYLIEKNFCDEDKIHFIFGVVTPSENLTGAVKKNYYADGKTTFDICFVAHKYSKHGRDKGYDTFINVAGVLSEIYDNVRFHVVGGFDEKVMSVSKIADKITFYGSQPQAWLREFFRNIDIILSPNIPYVLHPGAFDGFPTASCTDAALSKVAMFCTDELNLNENRFRDGEEIVIIKPDVDGIVSQIEYYIKHPELLRRLSEAGYIRAKKLYSYDAQILPRIRILEKALAPHRFIKKADEFTEVTHTAYSFDNSDVISAAVSIYSLLLNGNPSHEYNLSVANSDITHQNRQKLLELTEYFPNATLEFTLADETKPWVHPDAPGEGKWFSLLRKTNFYEDYVRINQSSLSNPITPASVWQYYSEPDFPVTVSVLCCTYNHGRFIRRTLEYIVAQETDYSFEVIVSDDASTDDTQSIIREFMSEYPHLFKCILREKNAGIGQNYYEALQLVEGKYLAICDGDDYWINPQKLQFQTDLMEKNPEYSICCSSYVKYDVEKGKEEVFDVNAYISASWELKDSYGFRDLMYCRFISSCTTVIRWRLHGRVPEFIKHYFVIDYPLTLIHAAFGRIFVANEQILARYNAKENGIFRENQHLMVSETRKLTLEVNQFLNFSFSEIVNEFAGVKKNLPVINPRKRERLYNFYINWVPPFMQKIYRRTRGRTPHFEGAKHVARTVYSEVTPEAVKRFYRQKIKPMFGN